MTTAFVLTAGGSLGAVQVGMLQVLAERDIQPDLHGHASPPGRYGAHQRSEPREW